MKLRFRGNSLRLRVNRDEVAALAAGARLEEAVVFPGGQALRYVLESVGGYAPLVGFENSVIRVAAPRPQVESWAIDDGNIGLYFTVEPDLKVAVEKDLECVDGPEEERDPAAYPRGRKAC